MKGVFLDFDTIGPEDINISSLTAQLPDLQLFSATGPELVAERISGAEIVIVNKVRLDEKILRGTGSLKLICLAATGADNVSLNSAKALGNSGLQYSKLLHPIRSSTCVFADSWADQSSSCLRSGAEGKGLVHQHSNSVYSIFRPGNWMEKFSELLVSDHLELGLPKPRVRSVWTLLRCIAEASATCRESKRSAFLNCSNERIS